LSNWVSLIGAAKQSTFNEGVKEFGRDLCGLPGRRLCHTWGGLGWGDPCARPNFEGRRWRLWRLLWALLLRSSGLRWHPPNRQLTVCAPGPN